MTEKDLQIQIQQMQLKALQLELDELKQQLCDAKEETEYQKGRAEGYKHTMEAQPKRKKGQWKDAMHGCHDSPQVKCSVCGEYYWQYFRQFNFCPNCGAEMQI